MKLDDTAVEIRLLAATDAAELTRLAELDTTVPPRSPLLGGMVDGRLVAAHSLATGESIADPFRPTADVVGLLQLHAGRTSHAGRSRGRVRAPRLRAA